MDFKLGLVFPLSSENSSLKRDRVVIHLKAQVSNIEGPESILCPGTQWSGSLPCMQKPRFNARHHLWSPKPYQDWPLSAEARVNPEHHWVRVQETNGILIWVHLWLTAESLKHSTCLIPPWQWWYIAPLGCMYPMSDCKIPAWLSCKHNLATDVESSVSIAVAT